MVRVPAVTGVDVERHAAVVDEGREEVFDQAGVEPLYLLPLDEIHVVNQKGTTRNVDVRGAERLVHRHLGPAVPPDSGLRSEGLLEGRPQDDPDVLDRVVIVDLDVAPGLEVQVEEAVTREQFQHVRKKSDGRLDAGPARSVQIDGGRHVRLFRLSLDLSDPARHWISFRASWIASRNALFSAGVPMVTRRQFFKAGVRLRLRITTPRLRSPE